MTAKILLENLQQGKKAIILTPDKQTKDKRLTIFRLHSDYYIQAKNGSHHVPLFYVNRFNGKLKTNYPLNRIKIL